MNATSRDNTHSGQSPRVSVVIAVHNGGDDLDRCLAAVAASTFTDLEIIVVDDRSTDGMTVPAAGRHGARVISLDRQCGPAIARNRGAAEARGDILFFTDADVELHADSVAVAVHSLQGDDGLSAVFGSYDDQPSDAAFLSQYRNLYHHWVHQTGREEASTFWTGCGAIWREVFLYMGGFAQDYAKPSIEDIELGSRMRQEGLRIRLEKSMLGKHMKRWRFWNLLKTDVLRRGVPWMSLVLRNRGAARDLNLDLKSRLATLTAVAFSLCFLVLPLAGHAAAVWPATVLLAAAVLGAVLYRRAGQGAGPGAIALALALLLTALAYLLAPDPWAALPLGLVLLLAAIQRLFFRYCADRRGLAFALAVLPLQMLFFIGCAVAVPLALVGHVLSGRFHAAGGAVAAGNDD